MSRSRVRSFQGRILLAILTVLLVPVSLGVIAGALTLQTIGTRSGTLGAWDAVAETGLELLEAVGEAGAGDSSVAEAAARHREALSESVRLSRLYSFVAERFVQILPVAPSRGPGSIEELRETRRGARRLDGADREGRAATGGGARGRHRGAQDAS